MARFLWFTVYTGCSDNTKPEKNRMRVLCTWAVTYGNKICDKCVVSDTECEFFALGQLRNKICDKCVVSDIECEFFALGQLRNKICDKCVVSDIKVVDTNWLPMPSSDLPLHIFRQGNV